MGGYGSGRDSYASTPTVAQCLTLRSDDFSDVIEDGNWVGACHWGDEHDIGVSIEATPDDGRRATLHYTCRSEDIEKEVHDEIAILFTDCNFGGRRPWWRCPCGDRVGTLHLPPQATHFRCRDCHELGYQSSRASGNPLKTATLRYERIHKQLAPDADEHHPRRVDDPFWIEKPPRMHWDTFHDLRGALVEAFEEWNAVVTERSTRLIASVPDVVGDIDGGVESDDSESDAPVGNADRQYGYYGQCEADAKSTDECCRQPAIGEHGKCYYHGGAPSSGIGEDQRDRAREQFEALLDEARTTPSIDKLL